MIPEIVNSDQSEEIRKDFLEKIKVIFPEDEVHGLEHALEVEIESMEVSERAKIEAWARGEEFVVNKLVLWMAALAHDIGYKSERIFYRHFNESVKMVKKIIKEIDYLSEREKRGLLMLVMSHDDTMYSYPFSHLGGKPMLSWKKKRKREKIIEELGFLNELRVLREADSFFTVGEIGFKRTTAFGEKRGVPFFAPEEDPLRAEMWDVSIVGNLRLCAQQAVDDAFTQEGKRRARAGVIELEHEIYQRCQKEGIDYYSLPELII